MLATYNYSPFEVLQTVFSSHPWKAWKFAATPRHWWNEKQNCIDFCEWVRIEELKLRDLSGWYTVSTKQFGDLGGIFPPLPFLCNLYS